MRKEREGQGVPLTAIHINLEERSIELEAEHGTVARLVFTGETVLFDAGQPLIAEAEEARPQLTAGGASENREREPTIVFTGRLKAKPREGKADRSGNPTAYARFAAHEEGRDEPHYLMATFHRQTAKIALGLPTDARIVAEGYVHSSNSGKRLDTFSVIRLHDYPGKAPRRAEKPS